ncbi:hypothetical protein [Sanguibacter inulinus]|uniref:Uncharacterized protein n=1 Tax=Sanguibacter inulinus TaxID=60922 RepID=A0A853ER87_9MICO|nr:hypothetical protein [Sanguibacter inulinus]MBF0721944.1 hypothetical protein [Sanguibacter inulinus]NYS93089.1 hypothetical protein [Sanguibacter inulinus]
MRPSEAMVLLTKVMTFDNRTLNDSVATSWSQVLADVDFADAEAAVLKHYAASSEWIMPAHIRAGVQRIRAERVRAVLGTAAPVPPPEVPADDVQAYQAWRRAFLAALGDGRPLHDAETVACEAAGIEPVHRELTAHHIPTFPRLERA